MDNFYALIARMKNIGRWSLMRSVIAENVQEHSHMVAVIAHALAVIRRDVFGVPCDPSAAAAAALSSRDRHQPRTRRSASPSAAGRRPPSPCRCGPANRSRRKLP